MLICLYLVLCLHVSSKESDFIKCIEIDRGIYVWTNTNTQYKINTLRKLFAMYGADAEELVFYMKDDAEEEAELVGTRFEIRRKYWNYALPLIQEAHADTGCFSGATGSKENWISGSFGVSGCNVACVANFDSARIELYIGTNDKENNKKLFDNLYSHRAEIESNLGCDVAWDRGDDKKSSRAYVEIKGVSIENEADWICMATFHAEWSKKVYDAMVPYIISMAQ